MIEVPDANEIRQLSQAMLLTLAAMLRHTLADAKNYVECQFADSDGPITVTIQRHDGLTPHQLRVKAEEAAKYWEKRARELGAEDY